MRIDTDGHYTTLGDVACPRGSCVARVPRGPIELVRKQPKDGELVADFSTRVVIDGPSVVRIDDPGALHTLSWVALGTGSAILVVGLIVPLLACPPAETTAPDRGATSTTRCAEVSDPVKIAWIAGLGAGLTPSLVGAIGVAVTNKPPRATVRPWAPTAPRTSAGAPRSVRISLEPFTPRPVENRSSTAYGVGLRAVF